MVWLRGERGIVQGQRSSSGDMRGFIHYCYVVRHITAQMQIWLGKQELQKRAKSGFSYVRYHRRVYNQPSMYSGHIIGRLQQIPFIRTVI